MPSEVAEVLPGQPTKVRASFDNGIVTLTIPKAEQAAVKHIKVQPVMIEAEIGGADIFTFEVERFEQF